MSAYRSQFEEELEKIRKIEVNQKSEFFDVLDPKYKERQFAENTDARMWAHFVFQGGGVLGVAHLGFFRAMEAIGVRPVGIAGTSAGAILATLLVAARGNDPDTEVGEKLRDILWNCPMEQFIDGPYSSRRLVKNFLATKDPWQMEMLAPIIGTIRRLLNVFGVNRGVLFEEWLTVVLRKEFHISSIKNLNDLLNGYADNIAVDAQAGDLFKVMATALPVKNGRKSSTAVKFVLPHDMAAMKPKYLHHSPAILARMSMSIPLFFEPFVCDLFAQGWRDLIEQIFNDTMNGQSKDRLSQADSVAFIDGGLLSNFPIDAFSTKPGKKRSLVGKHSVTDIPTIGSTLVSNKAFDEGVPRHGTKALMTHFGAVIEGMRHVRDRDAIRAANAADEHPDFARIRICSIDTGNHNWLNFQLTESEMADLYVRGIKSAGHFIETTILSQKKRELI